jgi:hypothetical protein
MTNPKRHHIVPQFLQHTFVDAEGFLHWARFSESAPHFGKSKPGDVFIENHIYSTINAGVKDAATERWLQQIESKAAPIIKRLLPAVRNRTRPTLSTKDGRNLLRLFMIQWFRSPQSQREAMSDAEASVRIDQHLTEIAEQIPLLSAAAERFKLSDRANLIKNTRVTALASDREHIVDILEERGIAFLRNTHPAARFILGSRPLVKLTPQGRHSITNPAVEMWLPIAPDIALGLGQGNRQLGLFDVSEREVWHVNLAIARQSSVIASGSDAMTQALAALR